MKEAINNRNEDVVEKEKVMFPEIVVRSTDDKPYYEIQYYDVTDKQWHLGYGSYNLDYVKQWKEECLEIVEGSITNILVEKIKERLEEKIDTNFSTNIYISGRNDAFGMAIEIVNQVAEEFATDTIEAVPVDRNRIIDEFAKRCKEHILCKTFGLHPINIDEIAEQMKGGNG